MNKTLEEIAVITYGKDYKKNPPGDNIPIYGTGGIMGYTSKPLNSGPSVLTGRKGSINKPFYVDGDFWNVDTIYCIKTTPIINTKWFYYNLCNKNLSILNEATGVPSVSTSALNKLQFHYVDFPHQRKIARILTTVDNIIEKTEAAIAKYKAIKQGMMHDLFTRGIDVKTGKLRPKFEDAPELYKESELGWIPKEWEEYKFDDILVEYLDFRGKTPKKLGMDWGNGEIRALSANNVHDGQIDFSKECYFGSIELYNKWMNKGDCKKGDVVMTMEAPLGNLAQIPDDKKYILSQRTILFKTREHLVFNDFLYYLLSFDLFQVELCKNSTGSTVTGIQQKKLAKILIALPKQISEQKLISDSINSANNRIKNEELFLSKYKELKSGLMQDLLTGKKKVAPDPEDYTNYGEPV